MQMPIEIVKYLYIVGNDKLSIYDKWGYLLMSVTGDNYYLTDWMVEDEIISEELGEAVFEVVSKYDFEQLIVCMLATMQEDKIIKKRCSWCGREIVGEFNKSNGKSYYHQECWNNVKERIR